MNERYEFRLFSTDQIGPFTAFLNQIQGEATSSSLVTPEFTDHWLASPGLAPEENCLTAYTTDGMVGYVLINPETPIDRVVLEGGLHFSYRNVGLASQLLDWAIKRSRELGVAVIHLPVHDSNVWAQELLASHQFIQIGLYWEMQIENKGKLSTILPEPFAIRGFREGDDQTLMEIQNTSFLGQWGFCPNSKEQIAHRLKTPGFSPEGVLFVCKDAKVVGYCWTRIEQSLTDKFGFILMLGVRPEYQGFGLGRAALSMGMEYLWSKGVQGIRMEVDSANDPARELYLSSGYQKVKEISWHAYRLGNG